jgi:hypothetical protein
MSTRLSYLIARERQDDLAARAGRASSLPPRPPRTVPPVVDAPERWAAERGIGSPVGRPRLRWPKRSHDALAPMKVELVIYEGFDELDALAPYEVLRRVGKRGPDRGEGSGWGLRLGLQEHVIRRLMS